MTDATRGLPLLSGPPPIVEEPSRSGCRKCGKEFGLLTRSRTCNHCGFSYCSTCSDHQALMPRSEPQSGQPGYEAVPVCAYCIPNLIVTASGRGQLRSMHVPHLRAYAKAYGLSLPQNALEKNEIIEAIFSARGPNGCLSTDNEDYYRRHSVPNRTSGRRSRSLFSRMADVVSNAANVAQAATGGGTPRPNPQPSRPNQQPRPQPRPSQPRPSQSRPSQSQTQYNASPPNANTSYAHQPSSLANPPPRATRSQPSNPNPQPPQPQPIRPARTPTPPPPSLDDLLEMTHDQLHKLSIGTLKTILWDNHVTIGQILEKDDLVNKVEVLLTNERSDREREARIRAEEEQAYLEQQARMREEWRRREAEREASRRSQEDRRMSVDVPTEHSPAGHESQSDSGVHVTPTEFVPEVVIDPPVEEGQHSEHQEHAVAHEAPIRPPSPVPSSASAPPTLSSSPPKPAMSVPERSGLCAICQDEEANIVVVDCGHLAMCRSCSELVMNSSRECPLCRTRIVTPQRLLRVFRT
ncbi:uncharacterized protein EI90DRAFT_3150094 [Cantharellus anzutake]|uniref:uncharacterized protein n=1 Tax=Cantharellus anzutake TaxID=1750568 RepID=UPI001904FF59|nr:uncharacterized protein EI90DRAFT_3150094 [Cantharellus anzutake]KAF8343111.1 hypothetical protein EI90DRAFT_3150094 [Cantharellus anzutake]